VITNFVRTKNMQILWINIYPAYGHGAIIWQR